MPLEFYKRGQGGAARAVTAGALLAVAAFGSTSLKDFVLSYTGDEARWVVGSMSAAPSQVIAITVFVALAVLIGWSVSRWRRQVDFLIVTESELRKVSWPSKSDLKHQTIVVLLVAFAFGAFITAADYVVRKSFDLIGLF